MLNVLLIAATGAIALGVLKNGNSSLVTLLRIAVVIVILFCIMPEIKELTQAISAIQFPEGVSLDSLKIMFKIFAVLAGGSIVSDICRDNGESSIAGVVEICVKVLAISMCIPVISGVVSVAGSFMRG